MKELMRRLRAWWRSHLPTRIDHRDEPPEWINDPNRRLDRW